jgi:hypothetical protein
MTGGPSGTSGGEDRRNAAAAAKPCVFIQTNTRQMIGALVSTHSLKRNASHPDAFDVHIMNLEDHGFFAAKEGRAYLRDGLKRVWRNDDLQSFTPLRFMPPELMGYRGRALVLDPDVFAVGDVCELLDRDMQGKAILCRRNDGVMAGKAFATSVMLLDCAMLGHWRVAAQFNEMFTFKRDYMAWISLSLELREAIGSLEPEWNDFDHLTDKTKLLHNTRRYTQPWKTGLPVDFSPVDKVRHFPPYGWVMRARRALFGDYGLMGRYRAHPDPNQERFFFGLLRECLEQGIVTEAQLRAEMASKHVRQDALELVRRAPPPGPQVAAA